MIKVRDFAPPNEELGLLGKSPLAGFERAVENANQWIDAFEIEVLSIETVVLPNIGSEEGTGEAELEVEGRTTYWYQIVRVWYRDHETDLEEEEIKVFDEPSETL